MSDLKLAALKEIQTLQNDIARLSTQLRGMSVPTADRTWAKFRDEHETLSKLLLEDYNLITQADAVLQRVQSVTAEEWTSAQAAEFRPLIHAVEQIRRDRDHLLHNI
jgi:hypothetical protein